MQISPTPPGKLMNVDPTRPVTLVTGHDDLGKRLDRFLAEQCLGISRARLQLLVRNAMVLVDGKTAKASLVLHAGQTVVAQLQEIEALRPAATIGEDIPLDILHCDDDVIAINKPAGMVVHPAKGHWSGTLTAALVHHFGTLSTVGGPNRPGVVHRLDRDTSGVILVARTDFAHTRLMKQFENRAIEKRYLAIVSPQPDRDRDQIDRPVGPHPYQREKMAIRDDMSQAKPASTFFEAVGRCGRFARIHCFPRTGRTHQIRVHLAFFGCPIVADRLYSGRSSITAGWIKTGRDDDDVVIDRQALHAESITFDHPRRQERITISAPLPADINRLWEVVLASGDRK
jgi:23S rRNA pseudouridine1911/1915/1917 synthase